MAWGDSGHPWVLSQGPNSWGPGSGPSSPDGPLVGPGRFSPLSGVLAARRPDSRPPRAWPSRSCPAPPPPQGLWGPVHPQSLSHGSSPACWERPGSGLGEGLSRVPGSQDCPGTRPLGSGVPDLRGGVPRVPTFPRAVPGADLPGDPSQGPPARVRHSPWPELVADPPRCPSRGGRSRRLSRAQRSLVPRCPPGGVSWGPASGGLRAGPGFGASRARTRPRPRPERRAPPRARPGGARTH